VSAVQDIPLPKIIGLSHFKDKLNDSSDNN
jgi:hypothetical protein